LTIRIFWHSKNMRVLRNVRVQIKIIWSSVSCTYKYHANFTIFISRICMSSTIRSWTDNGAVEYTNRSISARLSMKRFPRCTRQDYIIIVIITKEHFHREHRIPNWCRYAGTYKQWLSWQISFPRCEVYNEILNYEKMYCKKCMNPLIKSILHIFKNVYKIFFDNRS